MLILRQENRILLVVSNFGHLSTKLVPKMITELEGSLNTSLVNDRQVRGMVRIPIPTLTYLSPRPSRKLSKNSTRPSSIVTSDPSPA